MRGCSDLAAGNLDGDYSHPRGGVPSKGEPGVAGVPSAGGDLGVPKDGVARSLSAPAAVAGESV